MSAVVIPFPTPVAPERVIQEALEKLGFEFAPYSCPTDAEEVS